MRKERFWRVRNSLESSVRRASSISFSSRAVRELCGDWDSERGAEGEWED